jgi:hypothetical protein
MPKSLRETIYILQCLIHIQKMHRSRILPVSAIAAGKNWPADALRAARIGAFEHEMGRASHGRHIERARAGRNRAGAVNCSVYRLARERIRQDRF